VFDGRPIVTTLVEYRPGGSGGRMDDESDERHFGMKIVDCPPG
jgi:hypothetical protein